MENSENTKCGFIVILGPPNVGKSSLVNKITSEKVSIVTHKEQTTRNSICGVYTKNNSQFVFIDTPGIHESEKDFNKSLNMIAESSSVGADACIYLRSFDISENSRLLAFRKVLESKNIPIFEVWTKSDLNKNDSKYSVSSVTGEGIDHLLNDLEKLLPLSPFHFDKDDYTNSTVRFMSSEYIRLAVFENLHEELPYATAIEIEEFNETKKPTVIKASIIVERDSQKGIVIGDRGSMIKKIGMQARTEIEELLQTKVFLELRVKVIKNWTKNEVMVKRFGYTVEKK
jgi:GTP-binding protein Era